MNIYSTKNKVKYLSCPRVQSSPWSRRCCAACRSRPSPHWCRCNQNTPPRPGARHPLNPPSCPRSWNRSSSVQSTKSLRLHWCRCSPGSLLQPICHRQRMRPLWTNYVHPLQSAQSTRNRVSVQVI